MARIGIMGGTFDPIHYGHLVSAEAARDEFALERVVFVPARVPPHKTEQRMTDARHRYFMAVLATVTNPFFEVSRVEIDRPGPSYTIDTVRVFRETFGPDAEIYFITGADALLEILGGKWKDGEELLRLCRFIGATRPGYSLDGMRALTRRLEEEGKGYKGIHLVEIPALAVSSTDIRERVRTGRPIKYLVPEPVEHYIFKHGLYAGSP